MHTLYSSSQGNVDAVIDEERDVACSRDLV